MCYEVTIGKLQLNILLLHLRTYKKDLVIVLYMQQLHHLGCDLTDNE